MNILQQQKDCPGAKAVESCQFVQNLQAAARPEEQFHTHMINCRDLNNLKSDRSVGTINNIGPESHTSLQG